MLTLTILKKASHQKIFVLLFFLSIISIYFFDSSFAQENLAQEYRAKGYIEQQNGNFESAFSYYNSALEYNYKNAEVLNDLGILHEEAGFDLEAEKYYLSAIRWDPDYLSPYMNLAFYYQRIGDIDSASYYFRERLERSRVEDEWALRARNELLKIEPEYKPFVKAVERRWKEYGVVEKSLTDFDKVVEEAQNSYNKGVLFFKKGEYEKAVIKFNEALKWTPNHPKYLKARQLATQMVTENDVRKYSAKALDRIREGDLEAARGMLNQMVEVIPQAEYSVSEMDLDSRLKVANQLLVLGEKLFDENRFHEAVIQYDQALVLTPDNPKVIRAREKALIELTKNDIKQRSDRAVELLNSGDVINAREELKKLLAIIPNEPGSNFQ